ncbi:hypothetical protein RQM47_00630 [Rubrivirga sp. S365]|uniref:Lipoprotein n=1 Tax=Rubrivirga litoralis TaxID=3075598 RepID=A0ABU3BV32_9BACT|nr:MULTISPECIES: hypothetical protein [unclassified Rubrivirga]MDT0633152.1 hypothetical protein [Rubrivirga sp. F394]MDT7855141.1 hypothetical protein [Rubrivirga sp. S365]
MSLIPLLLAGCGVVRGAFEPSARGEVDAHVVYRLRPDCPTLLARTTDNGYTVMTPLGRVDVPQRNAFVGLGIEETGLFEGPVREGQSVFRYVPPAESGTWDGGGADVTVDVNAVRLDLPAAHARVTDLCGPLPPDVVGDDVPRVPAP